MIEILRIYSRVSWENVTIEELTPGHLLFVYNKVDGIFCHEPIPRQHRAFPRWAYSTYHRSLGREEIPFGKKLCADFRQFNEEKMGLPGLHRSFRRCWSIQDRRNLKNSFGLTTSGFRNLRQV